MSETSKKKTNWAPILIGGAALLFGAVYISVASQPQPPTFPTGVYNGEEEQAMWTDEQKSIYIEYKLREMEGIRKEREEATRTPLAPDQMNPYAGK